MQNWVGENPGFKYQQDVPVMPAESQAGNWEMGVQKETSSSTRQKWRSEKNVLAENSSSITLLHWLLEL